MKAIDLSETYLQRTCSNSLPLKIERLSFFDCFLHKVDCLIIGDIRKISHILLFFFFKKIVIVDDGMITVSVIKSDKNFLFIKGIIKRTLIKFILNFNNKKIDYYTIFLKKEFFNKEIKLNFIPNKIIHDDLISKSVDSVLLVGMDLVELGIVGIKYYQNLISEIIKKNGSIYYYPHRNETIIHNIEGLVYLERKYNIEKFILKETRFSKIISFYSTTLVLLSHFNLSDISFNFIRIENDEIKKYKEIINNSYKYIESIGIEEY